MFDVQVPLNTKKEELMALCGEAGREIGVLGGMPTAEGAVKLAGGSEIMCHLPCPLPQIHLFCKLRSSH